MATPWRLALLILCLTAPCVGLVRAQQEAPPANPTGSLFEGLELAPGGRSAGDRSHSLFEGFEFPYEPEQGRAEGTGTVRPSSPLPVPTISGNPAASNISPGTGDLGRVLGLDQLGIRLGGVWIMDENSSLLGGRRPGHWAEQNLFVLDTTFDLEKMIGWQGGKLGLEFLNHNGSAASALTGDLLAYDGLDCIPPLGRTELYELWYLQTFFDRRLSIRIGKQIPTYDFANIADVTPLIMRSIFVMATMLPEPGYPDSATGVSVKAAPLDWCYAQFGWYDGRFGGSLTPTGLLGPQFNGQYFYIGEAGLTYSLGPDHLEGKLGIGGWRQTGKLKRLGGGTEDGAAGLYLFAKQHLWYENPGVDRQGLAGYLQYGAADPATQPFSRYFGCGLTWTGLIPGRDSDSLAVGLACGRLSDDLAPHPPVASLPSGETMLQGTYQAKLTRNLFVQPTLTYIINPGTSSAIRNPLPLTLRVGLVF
jgi:porin